MPTAEHGDKNKRSAYRGGSVGGNAGVYSGNSETGTGDEAGSRRGDRWAYGGSLDR